MPKKAQNYKYLLIPKISLLTNNIWHIQ